MHYIHGNVNSNNNIKEYYTIVEDGNEEKKLNIGNYIARTKINKSYSENNIIIEVLYKDVFVDYEIYNIKIMNNSGNSIKIDSQETTNTIYGINDKDKKYVAFANELIAEELVLKNTQIKTIKIKFNKYFNYGENIKTIYFDDIVLDYDNYKEFNNKELYQNRKKIKVNI